MIQWTPEVREGKETERAEHQGQQLQAAYVPFGLPPYVWYVTGTDPTSRITRTRTGFEPTLAMAKEAAERTARAMSGETAVEERLPGEIGDLFRCQPVPGYETIRLRTPFLDPSNDLIDLYVLPLPDGKYEVSDGGETYAQIGLRTADDDDLNRRWEAATAEARRSWLALEIVGQTIVVTAGSRGEVAAAAMMTAQAAIRMHYRCMGEER